MHAGASNHLSCRAPYRITAANRCQPPNRCHAATSPHNHEQGSTLNRREAFLQLSSTVLLGSVGLALGSQGVLAPAHPAWAAGQPRELTGPAKAAVDKALDKFVVKSKVCVMFCCVSDPGTTAACFRHLHPSR
jgi:hypothetical protein